MLDELEHRFVPLGKLLTGFVIDDQGHVAKFRYLPAQGLVDGHLLWRVRNVVIAAEHVADLHQVVVNDNGKVVRWHPVALLDDKVAPN